jgi:hypothetical protein
MSAKIVIAVAYWPDQRGNRRFNFLTKDEKWFWKNMRVRVNEGLMPNLDECAVVYLAEPMPMREINHPGKLGQVAPDPYANDIKPSPRLASPTSMDKLLADISERKLISELANLARPDGVDA